MSGFPLPLRQIKRAAEILVSGGILHCCYCNHSCLLVAMWHIVSVWMHFLTQHRFCTAWLCGWEEGNKKAFIQHYFSVRNVLCQIYEPIWMLKPVFVHHWKWCASTGFVHHWKLRIETITFVFWKIHIAQHLFPYRSS